MMLRCVHSAKQILLTKPRQIGREQINDEIEFKEWKDNLRVAGLLDVILLNEGGLGFRHGFAGSDSTKQSVQGDEMIWTRRKFLFSQG